MLVWVETCFPVREVCGLSILSECVCVYVCGLTLLMCICCFNVWLVLQ